MDNNGISTTYFLAAYALMLLIWCGFGYWGGKIAARKGYSFWIGFAAGFFGGVVGIIVLYIIRDARNSPASGQQHRHSGTGGAQYPQRNRACPSCQNLVPYESEFCSYCGARSPRTPVR